MFQIPAIARALRSFVFFEHKVRISLDGQVSMLPTLMAWMISMPLLFNAIASL
jgi:hypothetical protein